MKTLKETIARLEMEKSEAVNLGLRFESHKTKSKQVEEELLSALSERDSTIEGLQQSLKELSREVLLNSKEDQMRSMCPELESSCERICNKCHELEGLLPVADATELERIACQCDQLRSEIAATRIKLESVQEAFSQASCEVSQKTSDCERLTRQVSTAQDDFGLLQVRYNSLEQQWQGQQLAIATMQADYQAIQQKYQKLQDAYEELGQKSDDQCRQLQQDNTRLQGEIGTLKERVEEAQRKLMQAPDHEASAKDFKAENERLKVNLEELEAQFKGIQQEYDSLSNQLVESIQENDALREELKHRPARNFDVDSMKSSGVGTECSEPEHESDPGSDLLQQFVQLLESVQQIELQHNSAHSRLFRASRLERTQIVPSLKLCLGSAEFIEGDTAQLDDSVCLKGFLKRLRFRIVRLGEEQQSKDVVFQLEQDLIEKTMQVEAAEDTINQMSEQIQSLEAALLEKSSVVSMVEDYQLKIDSLEKQNAELQDKIAKESPTSDSLTEGDTLIGVPESPREDERELQEVASLKATLAELRAKVCDLQSELEGQLRQMQLKDGNIAKMQKEIEEMGKRCSSTGLRLVELEEDVRQKQDLLDRQTKKLSDGMILIDQLQERNAQLEDRNIKAEESLKRKEELEKEKWKQANLSSEQKKQIEELEESLGRAKEELRKLEKVKTDEINALQLEFMVKLEESEIENRSKFRSYSLELEESKEGYDKTIATLKEQLSLVGEELSSVTAQCQEELKAIKGALEEKITQAEEERKTLAAQHQEELEKIKGMVKEKLEEAERKKANLEVDHKAELEKQKVEKQELEKLYQKSQGELQTQLRTREQNILEAQGGANEKIEELQTKYDQQVLELDKLKQEKMVLQSKIQDANAQHSSTVNNLVKLETEMAILTKQNVLQKCHFEEKMETFKLKINDLEEALHGAKLKLLRHEEMVSQHEQLKNCLTEANESSCNLQKKVERLRADLQTSQQETSNRAAEIEKLRSELKEAEDARTCVSADQLVLATQLKEVQEELSLQARKFQREVADLQGSIDELQLKLKSLQEIKDQLEIANGELKVSLEKEHKLCASLKENLAELEESKALLEEQMRAKEAEERTQELRSELETKSIESLESIIFDLQVNKRQLEEKLSILKGKDEENAILKVQLSSKEAALESLLADKSQMEENFGALKEELTKKCEELQSTLKCRETSLQNKSKQLELHLTILNEKDEDNARLEAQLASKEAELASLQPAVTHYKLAIETANNKVLEVGKKSDELTTECERLRSSLKSKEACLQKKKRMLKENITMLKQKDEECARLKDQLKSQGAALTSFQQAFTNLQSALDAANSRSLEMEKEVDDLTKECERLRVTLKSREASYRTEKVRMDGTISSLLEDKRNLEEKFCTVSEFSTKLESELAALQAVKLNGGNLLHESSSPTEAPSSASAHSSKKTKDRCGAGESGPKKSATIECAVRKNRRMTAYDEHRKQSFWIDSEDRGTMTESMTGDCICSELNCKNRLNLNSRRS
ncbi:early endosome antigen 1 isoform X2 [Drosophila ficusphila]|nr:early endosome antigen 1 isoform X2 [Drosophila ficusphila]XP_017057303.1 early endosome antigen 1 isoform X2 [Drosophila ficusphila]